MNYFREFYQGVSGKYPDNFGPIRLREEVEGTETAPPADDPSAKAH